MRLEENMFPTLTWDLGSFSNFGLKFGNLHLNSQISHLQSHEMRNLFLNLTEWRLWKLGTFPTRVSNLAPHQYSTCRKELLWHYLDLLNFLHSICYVKQLPIWLSENHGSSKDKTAITKHGQLPGFGQCGNLQQSMPHFEALRTATGWWMVSCIRFFGLKTHQAKFLGRGLVRVCCVGMIPS